MIDLHRLLGPFNSPSMDVLTDRGDYLSPGPHLLIKPTARQLVKMEKHRDGVVVLPSSSWLCAKVSKYAELTVSFRSGQLISDEPALLVVYGQTCAVKLLAARANQQLLGPIKWDRSNPGKPKR